MALVKDDIEEELKEKDKQQAERRRREEERRQRIIAQINSLNSEANRYRTLKAKMLGISSDVKKASDELRNNKTLMESAFLIDGAMTDNNLNLSAADGCQNVVDQITHIIPFIEAKIREIDSQISALRRSL